MNTRKPDWRGFAACADVENPEIFFFDGVRENSKRLRERTDEAQAICAGCPVQEQCLDLALALPQALDNYGIYAGLTAWDRRDLRSIDVTAVYDSNPNVHAWLHGGDRTTRAPRVPGGRRAQPDRDRADEARADRRFA